MVTGAWLLSRSLTSYWTLSVSCARLGSRLLTLCPGPGVGGENASGPGPCRAWDCELTSLVVTHHELSVSLCQWVIQLESGCGPGSSGTRVSRMRLSTVINIKLRSTVLMWQSIKPSGSFFLLETIGILLNSFSDKHFYDKPTLAFSGSTRGSHSQARHGLRYSVLTAIT